MTRRSRLLPAILAVLILLMMAVASGCASGQSVFHRTADGQLEYTDGSGNWTWDNKGGSEQITLNNKLFAVIMNGSAQITLPALQDQPDTAGRLVNVTTDSSGSPLSIKAAWDVVLTKQDYALMNSAFSVQKMAGTQNKPGSLGWVIFLLLVIIGGVLLFVYAGALVNSWKLGGIFNGTDTAKTLLIFKVLGILVMVIGVLILLAVIF